MACEPAAGWKSIAAESGNYPYNPEAVQIARRSGALTPELTRKQRLCNKIIF
jgi:hypothetical protein